MSPVNLSVPVPEKSFQETLDNACGRLQEKQAEYSIKKLEKLDEILCKLESELNVLIGMAVNSGK